MSHTNHGSQSQVNKHQHEDGRPEGRHGEPGNGRWVDDEGKSHTCRRNTIIHGLITADIKQLVSFAIVAQHSAWQTRGHRFKLSVTRYRLNYSTRFVFSLLEFMDPANDRFHSK